MSSVMFLHTPHARGPQVTRLQQLLQKAGYYHAAVDGEFGPYTSQAVYRAKYWLGYMKPDHYAGDVLISYLTGARKLTALMRVRASLRRRTVPKVSQGQRLLDEARAHLGIKESPPNSNICMFTSWYGMVGSWCAMFCSYCANRVGFKQFQAHVRYAYVPYIVADAHAGRENLVLVHTSQVRPGDLVCYDWNKDGVADHVGIFEAWIAQGNTFSAIEGNTGVGNDSDGGEVMRRPTNSQDQPRYVSEVQAFVRITR